MRILVFANAFHSISGGDKIFVEFSKRWEQKRGVRVQIVTNEKGKEFCLAHGVKPDMVRVWPASVSDKLGLLLSSAYKSASALVRALFWPAGDWDVVFSASFILPDLLPGLILKLRNPAIKWVVASYIFISPPWSANLAGKRLNTLILYLVQKVSLFCMKRFADGIFIASEWDLHRFEKFSHTLQVVAIRGGVDFELFSSLSKPSYPPLYDAVYLGRFHPQKNISELLEIWKSVIHVRPTARLALVGEGPLESTLRRQVQSSAELSRTVEFLGVLDGFEKAQLYGKSGMFVSASRFDSGIIALDEAMACGIPGIVYDLPHLYYPKGVIKIAPGDRESFGKAIISLIAHPARLGSLGRAAKEFAATLSWEKKADEAFRFLKSLYP